MHIIGMIGNNHNKMLHLGMVEKSIVPGLFLYILIIIKYTVLVLQVYFWKTQEDLPNQQYFGEKLQQLWNYEQDTDYQRVNLAY